MADDGSVYQEPSTQVNSQIISLALRDIPKYYQLAGSYDEARCIYAETGTIDVRNASFVSQMECDAAAEYTMYELPENASNAIIVPVVDNASFTYLGKEYSFGEVEAGKVGKLKLDESADDNFIITNDTDIPTDDPPGNDPSGTDPSGSDPSGTNPSANVPSTDNISPTNKPASTRVQEIQDLPAVKIKKPKAARKAATVKWKKVSSKNRKKIARIQIQYSRDKKFKRGVKTVYAKKSLTSKKIRNLKSRKTYYVRLRTYKKTGGIVHVSKWSKVKRIKIR